MNYCILVRLAVLGGCTNRIAAAAAAVALMSIYLYGGTMENALLQTNTFTWYVGLNILNKISD